MYREQKQCPVCERPFTATGANRQQTYCSTACAGVARGKERRALHRCPCLAHAEKREQAGLPPLPVAIGGHEFVCRRERAAP